MPRTPRLSSTLARAVAARGKAAAAVGVGAAALLAGAGTASAATLAATPHPHTAAQPAALAGSHTGALGAPASGVLALGHAATPVHADATAPAAAAPAAAPAAARPAAPAPAQPYQVYDSVTPSQIPSGAKVATYADGGYAVSPANVAGRNVTWIDTNGSDPRASVLDVEPGDATPQQAASWTWNKLHNAAGQIAVIYTYRSAWPAAQAAIATLPQAMQHQVRWWIADPTGVPHVVPGAQATQWFWGHNYDISTALPGSGV